MSREFEGKVVIVTGSSSGIGEATALMFAERGAKVTVCGRDAARVEAVKEKCIEAEGGKHKEKFISVCGDVTERDVRKEIVDKTVKTFGHLDVLVACHGIGYLLPSFLVDGDDTYDSCFNVNLKSVFFLIQLALPHLEKTGGNIVCCSSVGAKLVNPGNVAYGMSKNALDQMVRCLALEFAGKGIRVNSLAPGFNRTRIGRNFGDPTRIAIYYDFLEKVQPLYGRASKVEEPAEAITFLASDRASFITGQLIQVDGGVGLSYNRKVVPVGAEDIIKTWSRRLRK